VEIAHPQPKLLPKPARANEADDNRRADDHLPAVEEVGQELREHRREDAVGEQLPRSRAGPLKRPDRPHIQVLDHLRAELPHHAEIVEAERERSRQHARRQQEQEQQCPEQLRQRPRHREEPARREERRRPEGRARRTERTEGNVAGREDREHQGPSAGDPRREDAHSERFDGEARHLRPALWPKIGRGARRVEAEQVADEATDMLRGLRRKQDDPTRAVLADHPEPTENDDHEDERHRDLAERQPGSQADGSRPLPSDHPTILRRTSPLHQSTTTISAMKQ
jgi:hypothetical protein